MNIGLSPQRVGEKQNTRSLPAAIGEAAAQTEAAAIDASTNGVYNFRVAHPLLYGLIAFVVGSGFIGIFTMTTYSGWTFQGIDLETAIYQVVLGSLGGGIVMVVLAFAYARTVRSIRLGTRKQAIASRG